MTPTDAPEAPDDAPTTTASAEQPRPVPGELWRPD